MKLSHQLVLLKQVQMQNNLRMESSQYKSSANKRTVLGFWEALSELKRNETFSKKNIPQTV